MPARITRAKLAPTTTVERVEAIDVLRGFAIFGILLANVGIMSGVRSSGQAGSSTLDAASGWLTWLFVDGSFFPLFSVLFGLGLAIQMSRAQQKNKRFVPIYLRRLFFLMVIALLHWFLVWDAFILINYAALGVPLLLFCHRSPRALLALGALCLALQGLASPLSRAADKGLRAIPATASFLERHNSTRQAHAQVWKEQGTRRLSEGSYSDTVTERAERFVRAFSRPNRYYPWAYGSIFAMLLFGLAAGRHGIARVTSAPASRLQTVVWCGLGVGVVGNLGSFVLVELFQPRWGSAWYVAAAGLDQVGGPALSACYAAAVLLALRHRIGSALLSPLAPVGRMALSNYILQSVICTTIFYGYGLGFYGRVGEAEGLLLAIGVFIVQIPLSRWWLHRFQFGPAEWFWRSLTYGQVQPFRAQAQPAIALAGN